MNWKTNFQKLTDEWRAQFSYSSAHEAMQHVRPLTRHGTKGVFVFPDTTDLCREWFEAHAELEKKIPVLALLPSAAHLAYAPKAGGSILVCPDYPEVALTAIRSASWIVTLDPFVTQLAKDWGIACFAPGGELPWDPNSISASVAKWSDILSRISATPFQAPMVSGNPEYGICAVADSKFIGFFFGLVENLLQVSKVPFRIFLLALDEEAKALALQQYPHLPLTVFLASEVWPAAAWQAFQHKPIAERAYASKPRAILEAVKQLKGAPLYFCDVDIHFTDSPEVLRSHFGPHKLLFMPQWSDVFAWARFHGMFNSGLVGVLPGGEPFLKWWAEMCVPFCRVEMEKGYFTDQVFLDMGLWHFPEIGVYREMDQNVAPWNRRTLGVYRPGQASGELRLKDHRSVRSFHAAGPDSDGFFQLKFAWDQVASFFSVLDDPDELRPLYRNTLDQQLTQWPALQQALQVRANWNRRFRRAGANVTPLYISTLLSEGGKKRSRFFMQIENAWNALRKFSAKKSPDDGVSRDEQKTLVDIQQKFAFHSLQSSQSLSSSSRS